MKERPIIFAPEFVRAILDGRNTMTRRVVKPQPDHVQRNHGVMVNWPKDGFVGHFDDEEKIKLLTCPFGQPGDRLWVRETWAMAIPGMPADRGHITRYRADGEQDTTRWRSPVHMPRWASRLTLELTEVRVEKLCAIQTYELYAEGFPCEPCTETVAPADNSLHRLKEHWDSLNATRGYGWDTNPWVWVLTFRRMP